MSGTSEPASSRRFLISGTARGGLWHVHRDAHQLRTGLGEFKALARRAGGVGRVRIGHGLHDDGRASAHLDFADLDAEGVVTLFRH